MARNINQIVSDQLLRQRDRAMGASARPGGSPAMMMTALNGGATMAGPLGSGIGSVDSGPVDPALLGLPPVAPQPRVARQPASRVEGTSPLPVMDEDEQNIVALAKSFLANGTAFDMPSAMQMAREYAANARAEAAGQMDAAVAAGDAQADARQAQRAMAQGVVPMEGETAADIQFRNRPLDQQEATLGFQEDTADNVTRGLRDGTVRQPGSQAWNEEAANWYAGDHGIDEAGDAQIVRDLARRLGREPRPEEVADEKKWRGWVNENPGSERQARYNKAGYDAQYEANQRQFNDAERKKYGPPINTATIDPETGEWTKPVWLTDLSQEQQVARAERDRRQKSMMSHPTYEMQRRQRLADRAGISDEQMASIVAQAEADNKDPEAILRGLGNSARRANMQGRLERRAFRTELAGGSQNINAGNARAFAGMSMLPPEDRVRALLYSGPGGALAAQVDAAHNQQLTELGQRVALGKGFQQMTPQEQALVRLQQQQAEDARRAADPALAGAQEIAAGNLEHPAARTELERLARAHDTTNTAWGMIDTGFSYDNEDRLAKTLQQPPYNMKPAEAEAAAHRAAERRRYVSGSKPGERNAPQSQVPPGPSRPTGSRNRPDS